MKSLTIHNMDQELARAINQIANSTGLSKNKIIKRLLRKALNLSDSPQKSNDFSEFCGVWTKDEKSEFDDIVKIFDTIDEDLWK